MQQQSSYCYSNELYITTQLTVSKSYIPREAFSSLYLANVLQLTLLSSNRFILIVPLVAEPLRESEPIRFFDVKGLSK